MFRAATSLLRFPKPDLPRIDRPTLVLGSAPGSAVPSDPANWFVATVNASQASYRHIVPDLTIMGTGVMRNKPVNQEAKEALRNLRTRHLITVRSSRHLDWTRPRLARIGYHYDAITRISQGRRAESFEWATGIQRDEMWPSTGVFLTFMCLEMGAPFVVMAGFSFSTEGHAYNQKNRERAHIDADRNALAAALDKGRQIFTSASRFAHESGVPLFSHADETKSFTLSSGRIHHRVDGQPERTA